MQDGYLERKDVTLIHVLLRDSRATDQQISLLTGLPSSEVAVRIESMMEAGVIRSFNTKPSLASLGAMSVLLFGKSRLSSMEEIKDHLLSNDRVAWAALSTGGRLYVAVHLVEGTEMDAQVRKVEADAMMLRPTAAVRDIYGFKEGTHEYSPLEWDIVRSLSKDSRKSVEEVAREVTVPVGEATKCLDELMENGSLDFSIALDPNQFANPMCMFHMETMDPFGLEDRVRNMMERNAPAFLFFNTYSNQRQLLTAMAIPQDFEDLRGLMRSLRSEGGFEYVDANPIIASCLLDTWRDKLVIGRGRPSRTRR
jgi:DNA-binding Lrp family transcriptional regulator